MYSLLKDHAKQTPDAIAITAPGRRPLSYARLWLHIEEVVEALNGMGLGRNDRVAIVLSNGSEMATAFLAVTACAIGAPLNPAYRADEFDFYLSDLNVKALIVRSSTDSPAVAVAKAKGISIIELLPIFDGEAGIFSLTGDQRLRPKQGGFAQPGDVALVLHTSGTTSKPKIVPLTQTNIFASSFSIKTSFNLTGSDRCLNVMPLFHVHGLIGAVLSSLTAGGSIVCTPGFYAPRFFEWMEEFHPTWYTAVPTMHQAILARSPSNREVIERRPLRFIRSCSSALSPKVMAELEGAFHAPVIESYGMTEASHQVASNPLPPRERRPGSVGMAAGSETAILDEAGQLLPTGETGEIVIRGTNVLQGYENNSTANESAFVNGWFRTGDQGYLDVDGYLFITGRLKEMINRGGEKISPREVDEVLMDCPPVAQAVAFAIPHNILGEDVAAAVVLHKGASATESEIRQFAATRLADFKVPCKVLILDDLPKGATGKPRRIGLAEKLGLIAYDHELSEHKAEFKAPRTALEEILTKMWIGILGVEKIGIHDNFFQLGGDSILAAQVISQVSERMQVKLSLLSLFDAPTVAETALVIEEIMIDEVERLAEDEARRLAE